jgi:CDP-diacylglycerol---serine O-phosphatidyltransferase
VGIFRELKLKDLVTLCGTICGISSIILALEGNNLLISASFIYFAMIFDLLDGYVAKKLNQCNDLGAQLDSLSDIICFGVAPAVLIYQAYTGPGYFPPYALLIPCILFIFGAMLRLTWFNVCDNKGYEGITTPVSASILLSLFFIDTFYPTFPDAGPVLGEIMKYIIPFALLFLPYLNISRFFIYENGVRTRKNRKLMILLFIFMLLGLICAILAFFSKEIVGPYIYVFCVAILVMLVFYIGIGVFNYSQRRKAKKEESPKTQ